MGKLENITIKRKKRLRIRRPLAPYTVLPLHFVGEGLRDEAKGLLCCAVGRL